MSSRIYPGLWSCLLWWDTDDGVRMSGRTDPGAYEDCERLLFALGQGALFEGRRVVKARIVPVSA